MSNINFALIGHGFMGHEHEKMLTQIDGIKLVGISDRNKEKLLDVKEGIKRYSNNEELFSDPEVDVVIIAANNNQHHDLVIQAAKSGKDIICEKPVALSTAELEDMIKTTKECGVRFTVHQQRRLDRDLHMIKEIFDQKSLGEVYLLKSSLYGYNGNMHDWHIYESEGGGMLYDWGVHLIDQILWMMPGVKVTSVFADLRNVVNEEVDDYFKILLRFDNNVMAEIELGTYLLTDKIQEKWFERHWMMSGNKGTAYIDGFWPEGKIIRTSQLLTNTPSKTTITAAGPTRSFGAPSEGTIIAEELPDVSTSPQEYFKNYIRAYHGKEDFFVKIPETQRVLRLMETIRESSRTGQSQSFE